MPFTPKILTAIQPRSGDVKVSYPQAKAQPKTSIKEFHVSATAVTVTAVALTGILL